MQRDWSLLKLNYKKLSKNHILQREKFSFHEIDFVINKAIIFYLTVLLALKFIGLNQTHYMYNLWENLRGYPTTS